MLGTFRRVFYVSSFTRVLSPSLRVGYVVCSREHVDALVDRKILDVLTGSSLQDLLVAQVLKSGRYRAHVEGLRRRLAKAQFKAVSALSEVGILFDYSAMGTLFSPTAKYGQHIRFNAAYAVDPQLVASLRKAIRGGSSQGQSGPACPAILVRQASTTRRCWRRSWMPDGVAGSESAQQAHW